MDSSALPPVNDGFCFTSQEFLQDDFTVDELIKNHRNDTSLEQLRQDLSSYLRTCRLALIDLINEDYSDFINLSDDLVGLDSNINNLIGPLEGIRGDMARVEDNFTETINSIALKMAHLKSTRQQRQQLESILNAHNSLENVERLCKKIEALENDEANLNFNIHLIERLAIQMEEINVSLNYRPQPLPSSFVSRELEPRCKDISKRVRRILEKSFLSTIARSDRQNIQRLYKIFSLNGQLDVLEKMLLVKIRPYLVSVISESRLEALGTEKFFNDIKNLLMSQFSIFFHLDHDCSTWFVNRIWSEVVSTLSLQSPLFASGNPDQFHSNYKATLKFLDSLKTDLDKDGKLSKDGQLSLITKKFNTQIYFSIRFQEIATRFEQSLKQPYTYQPQEERKFYHFTAQHTIGVNQELLVNG